MTQYDLINFDPFRNFSIGFDRMFDSLNEVSRINTSNFPPYNIRKVGKGKYQIEMALAGFTKSDIDCELQEGVLTIKAKKEDKDLKKEAAKAISKTKKATDTDTPKKKVWTASEISRLKPHEFEKFEKEIDLARLEGRIEQR